MNINAERDRAAAILSEYIPNITIVGSTGHILDEKVSFIRDLIKSSGIPQRINDWEAEDKANNHAGGRPRLVSTETILTLVLLSAAEQESLELQDIARTIHERLSDTSLELLGLPTRKRAFAKDWYAPVRFAFDRVVKTIDPKPGRRNKFPTQAEYEAILAAREKDNSAAKQVRLDWVTNTLLHSTMSLLPPRFWSAWQGDLTIDATVVPAYGKKGAPYQPSTVDPLKRHLAVEYDAGWYLRNANHDSVDKMKLAKKAVFGWDLTLCAMTKHDPNGPTRFPQLILGIGMTVPGTALIETGRRVIESIADRGHATGRVTGDRGYAAGAIATDFQLPLRLRGYEMVTDYKATQLGDEGLYSYAGALGVEGAFYCPAMPKNLVNATKDYRAGAISWDVWQKRISKRKDFLLRRKGKPNADGSVTMMCPARGSGATASCPVAGACSRDTYDKLVPVLNPPHPDKRGDICNNKVSVKFPIEHGAKLQQKYHFGSQEWRDIYQTDRSTIEGINGALKTATIPLDGAAVRRVRGYTAQYLLITMLVATENLRRIQSFRDSLLQHTSTEARNRQLDAKHHAKLSRKSKEHTRFGAWDGFPEKTDAEREETARVVKGTN